MGLGFWVIGGAIVVAVVIALAFRVFQTILFPQQEVEENEIVRERRERIYGN